VAWGLERWGFLVTLKTGRRTWQVPAVHPGRSFTTPCALCQLGPNHLGMCLNSLPQHHMF